jgi:hypothetical protein
MMLGCLTMTCVGGACVQECSRVKVLAGAFPCVVSLMRRWLLVAGCWFRARVRAWLAVLTCKLSSTLTARDLLHPRTGLGASATPYPPYIPFLKIHTPPRALRKLQSWT